MTRQALASGLTVLAVTACQGPAAGSQSQVSRSASPPAASALPSIAAAPTPSSTGAETAATPAPPAPGPRCHTSQLGVKFAGAQGAAGTMFLSFRLSNRGTEPCLMRGFVGMRMLDAAGAAMPTRVVRNGGMFSNQQPASSFKLPQSSAGAPAATAATFQVAYSTVPRTGETVCPQAYQLLVTPPDELDYLSLSVDGWTLAPCNRGELDVTALRPPGVASG